MSELKAFTFGVGQYMKDGSPCVVAFDGEKNPRLASDEKFYQKSEADKVFRRLKARLARKGISIQQLEADKNHNWRKYCTAMAELRHHKYKRCLAMAGKCRLHARWLGDNSFYKKEQWALKWHRRWLELAEEPTWAKFLQLIHKEVK